MEPEEMSLFPVRYKKESSGCSGASDLAPDPEGNEALGCLVRQLGVGAGYGLARIGDGVESQILGSDKAGRERESG